MINFRIVPFAAAFTMALAASTAHAAFDINSTFDADAVYVARLGGTTSAAQSVFIDEYDRNTGALRGTIDMAAGGNDFTIPGADDHDGILRFSNDGSALLMGGYRAAVGAPDPRLATAALDPRVIATVSGNGSVNTSRAFNNIYDNVALRAVVSPDGRTFYTAGSAAATGGVRLVTAANPTTSTSLSTLDVRNARIDQAYQGLTSGNAQNLQFYVTTGSSTLPGGLKGTFLSQGVGLPQSAITYQAAITDASDTGQTFVPKADVLFFDLSPTIPGIDTAYSTGGKSEYEKWALLFSGGNYVWTRTATVTSSITGDTNALEGFVTGGTVTLFAASDTGVYKLTDASGYNDLLGGAPTAFPATAFIAAPAGNLLRGIAILPAPEPLSALLMAAGLPLLLRRRATR